MKKVIFVYEQHQDPSAAQALKELLGKINGNVSLCLEMPEQNIKATLVKEANKRAGIVKDFRTLKNKTPAEKVEYVSRWLTANQDRVTLTVKSTGVVELSLSELNQIIDEIKGKNLGTYKSLSATLDSVKLAESKGMKVCAY